MQEQFQDIGKVITVRYGLEFGINRTNNPSVAYNSLRNEYKTISRTKAPLFKHEAIILPIMRTWRSAENNQVIGCIILSSFGEAKPDDHLKGFKEVQQQEDQIKLSLSKDKHSFGVVQEHKNIGDDSPSKRVNNKPDKKLQNSGYLKNLMINLNYFFNLCILDMSSRKKKYNFETLSRLSKNLIFKKYLMKILVKIFKYETDIRDTLSTLRINISNIFGYDDCALLIKDQERNYKNY